MEVPWTDTLPTRIREACKPGRILSGRGRHPVSYKYRINPVKRVRLLRLHVCILCFYSSLMFCFYSACCVRAMIELPHFASGPILLLYREAVHSSVILLVIPPSTCFLSVSLRETEPVNFSRDRLNDAQIVRPC